MARRPLPDEELLNRHLRRVDWRFLLSDPWPHRVVCWPEGTLASALRQISPVVDDGRDLPAGYDLAVAANPDQALLTKMAESLREGGACYTEWRLPRVRGRKAVRRRLEAAGFESVATYWPWPWPSLSSPRFWLPLDAPPAIDHFLKTQPRVLSPFRRWGRAAMQAIWRAGVILGVMVPVCATARRPLREGAAPGTSTPAIVSPLRDLEGIVRDTWTAWSSGQPPDRLSWLLLTRGERSSNKVVAMVFAETRREPVLLVKMVRVREATGALMREASILRSLQSLPSRHIAGIPEVLFLEESAAGTVLGETVLAGSPISTHLRPRNYRQLALRATDWLARFALQTQIAPSPGWLDCYVGGILADFAQSFASVADSHLLHETGLFLRRLEAAPAVCEQRDFSPWNVLLDQQGELAILDWESAEIQGLPATDLVYFLAYLAFQLDHANDLHHRRKSYRALLDPTTSTGSVFAECLGHYATALDLPAHVLPPLRQLTWLIHSRSEYRRLFVDTVGRPDRLQLKQSLFLALWEEELSSAEGG